MVNTFSLSVALKMWRQSKQISLPEVERMTGMPQATFGRYERREGNLPGVPNMLHMSKILNLPINQIIEMAEYDISLNKESKQKDQ
ncbi:helix-turn-helix transcriptional regulator [Leuconostoc gelidum subsp. gelidum]|uniref:helix-turn-helix domain-containing protein n=1 Tax=Leuconostoc gelidum TaxID=1244 RepID=UPI001CC4F842|nr:helix-turn-helix transcriptional regulator [Leuconostoc gelidum]MBZ5977819.1 helix-turn-helix transcriptional regulator [Leuconostoc gelidum subsp. gelidum]MBZ6001860.1 helix-turn-helix transcriptional regulator [Leuconostoc gelidum subsp. gelidum]